MSADARFSRRTFEYANLAPVSILTVGRSNPFFVSPTGSASHLIAYNFIGDVGPTESYGMSRSLGGTAGIEIALPRDWTLEAYGAFAEELSEGGTNNQLNSTFLAEALGNAVDNPATSYSAARDGYFNPFGSGGANGDVVLDFISQGYTWSRYRSRISSANLMLDGSPLSLPGGDLRIDGIGLDQRGIVDRTKIGRQGLEVKVYIRNRLGAVVDHHLVHPTLFIHATIVATHAGHQGITVAAHPLQPVRHREGNVELLQAAHVWNEIHPHHVRRE